MRVLVVNGILQCVWLCAKNNKRATPMPWIGGLSFAFRKEQCNTGSLQNY